MSTNPPRVIVPQYDCPYCNGSGECEGETYTAFTYTYTSDVCDCVLDQVVGDEEWIIDTSPNDLTRGLDVVEGV